MRFTTLRRSLGMLAATVVLGTVGVAPVVAQSTTEAPDITVVAMDFHFDGLPTSVPAGTTLGLDNQGADLHELVVVRKNDGVTETWDELLALPEEEVMAKITFAGPIFAGPGEVSPDTLTVDQEGEYLAICFVPQGTTQFPEGSPDPEASFGPPHFVLGMRQEFTVTPAGTEVGPLPSPGHAEPSAPAEARVIELEMDAALQILQDGQKVTEIPVTIGETITFRITNTAGYAHNFWIGPDQALMTNQVEGLPGIPDYAEGTQEFTWTVPEDAASLKFGCTVPGHYMLMNGSFVVQE